MLFCQVHSIGGRSNACCPSLSSVIGDSSSQHGTIIALYTLAHRCDTPCDTLHAFLEHVHVWMVVDCHLRAVRKTRAWRSGQYNGRAITNHRVQVQRESSLCRKPLKPSPPFPPLSPLIATAQRDSRPQKPPCLVCHSFEVVSSRKSPAVRLNFSG